MNFYDELSPLYHLIYPNWAQSVQSQAGQLDSIIQHHWPNKKRLLDVSCGIGTQALGLAEIGYSIRASDLSAKEIERAHKEAERRNLNIEFSIADMRHAHAEHGSGFDLVISCDNSLPHLLTDEDLLCSFQQFFDCLTPGGGCLITVRDYDKEARGTNLVKHYGARIEDGKRYVLYQVWDFEGDQYDLAFFIVEEEFATGIIRTHVMRSRYYAISIAKLCELMSAAGFTQVQRLDGQFYQPVIIGTKPLEWASEI